MKRRLPTKGLTKTRSLSSSHQDESLPPCDAQQQQQQQQRARPVLLLHLVGFIARREPAHRQTRRGGSAIVSPESAAEEGGEGAGGGRLLFLVGNHEVAILVHRKAHRLHRTVALLSGERGGGEACDLRHGKGETAGRITSTRPTSLFKKVFGVASVVRGETRE